MAEPLMPVSEELVELLLDDESAVRAFIVSGGNKCRVNLVDWHPHPSLAYNYQHRAGGVAMVSNEASGPVRSANTDWFNESGLLEIQLTEGGGIRILLGRGTVMVGNTEEQAVFDGLAVAYTQRLIYWIGQLSEKYGYRSTWTVGLRMNGIRGLRSYTGVDDWKYQRPSSSMDQDSYSSTRTVATDTVIDDPEAVVKSQVGRLLRVLGSAPAYQ